MATPLITRHYCDTGDNHQTHYRAVGKGKSIVLLHPSPLSSAFMAPLATQLSDLGRVFAPDTAGYGMSDTLTDDAPGLGPYVDWLARFIDRAGLGTVVLYGSATGAQLTIEFARAHPEKVSGIILDNAAHFSDEERAEILPDYFPEVELSADGSHLKETWQMVEGLFQWFPWYAQEEANRIGPPGTPPEVMEATLLDYLRAGESYGRAYRAAFENEDASRVRSLTVPVKVIRWQGSIIRKYCDRYDEFQWPENVEMLQCGVEPTARLEAIRAAITGLL